MSGDISAHFHSKARYNICAVNLKRVEKVLFEHQKQSMNVAFGTPEYETWLRELNRLSKLRYDYAQQKARYLLELEEEVDNFQEYYIKP